jgi:hypothetical protein
VLKKRNKVIGQKSIFFNAHKQASYIKSSSWPFRSKSWYALHMHQEWQIRNVVAGSTTFCMHALIDTKHDYTFSTMYTNVLVQYYNIYTYVPIVSFRSFLKHRFFTTLSSYFFRSTQKFILETTKNVFLLNFITKNVFFTSAFRAAVTIDIAKTNKMTVFCNIKRFQCSLV